MKTLMATLRVLFAKPGDLTFAGREYQIHLLGLVTDVLLVLVVAASALLLVLALATP